jgi:hypothetical protein
MIHFMKRPFMRIGLILGGIIAAAVLAFLFGLLVMVLWNWIMPEVFGLKPLTYWQSWGIVLLAHILFKAGSSSSHDRHRHDDEAWKERFKERFKTRFWDYEPPPGSPPPPGTSPPPGSPPPPGTSPPPQTEGPHRS